VTDFGDIRIVLFDLDSTLIEHTREIQDLCGETFDVFKDQLGPLSPKEFWEAFWPRNHDTWYMMVDGVLSGDVARLYAFVNTLRACEADVSLARPMLEDWEGRIIVATRLFDDVLPTIDRLRSAGVGLGIITNGYTTMQRRKVHYHGLNELVDFVLISEEVGVHKPSRAIFDMALASAGAAAHQALFVGDTPSTDITGAHNADLRAVLMEYRTSWPEFQDGSVPRIRRLRELLPLLGLV
jgi:putative hydrolase of the HAD superfamily